MALTAEQLTAREGKLTASAVAPLMTGDEAKIMNLWRELVGDPSYVRDDLSNVWPVQLGVTTESLNLSWYEKNHGKLSRQGEVVVHSEFNWAACTLDGWDESKIAAVEAKHVNGFSNITDVVERYQPQLHWQMIVTGSKLAMLSVIIGANEPIVEEIPFDEAYASELWKRAQAFMECVWSLTPPIAEKPVLAPVNAEKVVDMQGVNSWAEHAANWIETKAAATENAIAAKSLRELVPPDAKRAFGHGVTIDRSKAGSLLLKELKA